jgi:MFS family permease
LSRVVDSLVRDRAVLHRPLLLVAGVVFAVSLAAFSRAPLLPDIGRELALSAGELSFITAGFAVGRLVMDLPAGRVADRHPPQRVLAGAGLALVCGSLWLASAQALWHAVGAAGVLGIASSVTNTTGMTLFSTRAPDARRGSAMATFSMALLSGQTFGPALGGMIASLGTWRTAQVAAAGIGAGVAVVCLVRGRRAAFEYAPDDEGASSPAESGPPLSPAERFVLAAIPFSVFFALAALPLTLVPVIGADEIGLPASTIGVVLGAGGLARFVGAATTGAVSDRRSRKAALVPGLSVMAAGVALLAVTPTTTTWVAAVLLLSVGSTGVAVAATILGDRTPNRRVGRQLSTFRFAGDLGLLCGPVVTGWLYENAGRADAVLAVAVLLIACALGAAKAITETRPTHSSAEDRPLAM